MGGTVGLDAGAGPRRRGRGQHRQDQVQAQILHAVGTRCAGVVGIAVGGTGAGGLGRRSRPIVRMPRRVPTGRFVARLRRGTGVGTGVGMPGRRSRGRRRRLRQRVAVGRMGVVRGIPMMAVPHGVGGGGRRGRPPTGQPTGKPLAHRIPPEEGIQLPVQHREVFRPPGQDEAQGRSHLGRVAQVHVLQSCQRVHGVSRAGGEPHGPQAPDQEDHVVAQVLRRRVLAVWRVHAVLRLR